MPRAIASSSPPPVSTSSPFLPFTIAVPVSWHDGSTPPAAMLAFFSSSSATNGRWATPRGRRGSPAAARGGRAAGGARCRASPGCVSSVSASGSTCEEPATAGLERRDVVGRRAAGTACRRARAAAAPGTANSLATVAERYRAYGSRGMSHDAVPRRARLDGRGAGSRRRPVGRADPAGGRELPDLGPADRAGAHPRAGHDQGSRRDGERRASCHPEGHGERHPRRRRRRSRRVRTTTSSRSTCSRPGRARRRT